MFPSKGKKWDIQPILDGNHALTTQGAVKELLLPLANDLVDLPWLSKNLELQSEASTVEK